MRKALETPMAADAPPIAADQYRKELDCITHGIIGAAHQVSSTLGPGFLEKVYENSLAHEIRKNGLTVDQQRTILVHYDGEVVGHYMADLLVGNCVIVEIKAVTALEGAHRSQCVNYLRATGLRVCLLLNFGRRRLEVMRIVSGF